MKTKNDFRWPILLNSPKRLWLYILALPFALLTATPAYTQASETLNEQTTQAIDSYLSRLENFGLSGSLLIGSPEEILFKKDYGINRKKQSAEPAYLVGSLTKQFTATGILFLEQKGLLSVNDPISKYLTTIPADKSNITIHQLLTHTSGLSDDYWDQHRDLSEEQYIEMMLKKESRSEPGKRYAYANIGYHLLSKIIEKVSNLDYETFLDKELFQQIKLKNTGFKIPRWKKGQVINYTDWTTEGSENIIKNPLDRPVYLQPEGSGGILSTTIDLYNWYKAIFHTDKVLNESSRKKLLTTELGNYAYGWRVYPTRRGTGLVEHGGHDSWVGVVTGICNFIDEDIVVIYLGNTHMGKSLFKDDLMNNIESIIWGGNIQMPPKKTLVSKSSNSKKYAGVYDFDGNKIIVSEGKVDHQLKLQTSSGQTIKEIVFPDPKKKYVDVQLQRVFKYIEQGDYETIHDEFMGLPPLEAIKQQYSNVWDNLKKGYGKYHGLQVLHVLPTYLNGRFNLQSFIALEFERGSYYLRILRNQHGRIHMQPIDLPKKLEAFLTPLSADEYLYWNLKTGISSEIKFQNGGLIINGKEKAIYSKT